MSKINLFKVPYEENNHIYCLKIRDTVQPLFDKNGFKSGVTIKLSKTYTRQKFNEQICKTFNETKSRNVVSKYVHFTNGQQKNEDHSLPFKLFVGADEEEDDDEGRSVKRLKGESQLDTMIYNLPENIITGELFKYITKKEFLTLMFSNKEFLMGFKSYYLKFFYVDIWRFFDYTFEYDPEINRKRYYIGLKDRTDILGIPFSLLEIVKLRISNPPPQEAPKSIPLDMIAYRQYGLQFLSLMRNLRYIRINNRLKPDSEITFLYELYELNEKGIFNTNQLIELHFDDSAYEERMNLLIKREQTVSVLPPSLEKLVLPMGFDTDKKIGSYIIDYGMKLFPDTLNHLVIGDRNSLDINNHDNHKSFRFDWFNFLDNIRMFEFYRELIIYEKHTLQSDPTNPDLSSSDYSSDVNDNETYRKELKLANNFEIFGLNFVGFSVPDFTKNTKLKSLTLISYETIFEGYELPPSLIYLDIYIPYAQNVYSPPKKNDNLKVFKLTRNNLLSEYLSIFDNLEILHINGSSYPKLQFLIREIIPYTLREFKFRGGATIQRSTDLSESDKFDKMEILELDYYRGEEVKNDHTVDTDSEELFEPFYIEKFPKNLKRLLFRIGYEQDIETYEVEELYEVKELPKNLVTLIIYGRTDKNLKLKLPEIPKTLIHLEIRPNITLESPITPHQGLKMILN